MKSPLTRSVPTPSRAVLRFLRTQNEEVPFFTPNTTALKCPSRLRIGAQLRHERLFLRSLTTSSRRCATVEASLINLDLFRPSLYSKAPKLASLKNAPKCKGQPQATLKGRNLSTGKGTPLLRRWWAHDDQRGKNGIRPEDVPPLPPFLDDVGNIGGLPGRGLKGKAGNELKLRCTEIDEKGNVTTVDGEFKKTELIAKYGLQPRDLRKIDSSLLPHILVRPSAILINLLHLRVLIKYNCVLVLDAYGSTDSHSQSQFMYDLCGRLSQKETSLLTGGLPYELRALEAVLINVTSVLEAEYESVSEPIIRILRELEEDIDRDKLRHLLIYSKKIGTFEQKARLVRDAIDDLLEADDDLVTMYLSERAQSRHRDLSNHTEVEMLLESYHKVCDEIVQESGNLVSNIRNTEEIVKAILDANRNSLMLLDLKFSIGTLGIGSGAFVASLYGMNLKNFIEESDFGFWGVTGWSFVFAAVVCSYGLKKLRRVQRVSMWGERGGRGRGSWSDVQRLGEGRIERDRADRLERADRVKKIRELQMETWRETRELQGLDAVRRAAGKDPRE